MVLTLLMSVMDVCSLLLVEIIIPQMLYDEDLSIMLIHFSF